MCLSTSARQSTGMTATAPDLPTDVCRCTAMHPAGHAEVWECTHAEIRARLCPCMHRYVCACIYAHVHPHSCICTHTMHTYTNTCMHTHIYTHTHMHA